MLSVLDKAYDIFVTIQDYDKDHKVISCPIYADFDGENAYEHCKEFVREFERRYDTYPDIFYSGKKGMHVVFHCDIHGRNSHLVVKEFVKRLGTWDTLDNKVYTSRRLWRVPNSFHNGGNRYKIYLTPEELFTFSLEEVREFAKETKLYLRLNSFSTSNMSAGMVRLNNEIEEITGAINLQLEQAASMPEREFVGEWTECITPCIQHMLDNEPADGEWNTTLFILAKFFKYHGVSYEDSLDIVLSKGHYLASERAEGYIRKVFKSTYASSHVSKIGCRYGEEGVLMHKFCDCLCPFSDFMKTVWFNNNNNNRGD